jgi:hypothetical protein
MVLACNKADLRTPESDSQCVSLKKAQAYAKTINTVCFETSAKTGKGERVGVCLPKILFQPMSRH